MAPKRRGRPAGGAAKRARHGASISDVIQDKCKEIADFLAQCETVGSSNLRQALQVMLPYAATKASGERDEEQAVVLKMVNSWLEKAEVELAAGVKAADVAIEKVEGDKSTREQKLKQATEAVEVQREKSKAAQRQLSEDETAEVKAEEDFSEAHSEVANWDEEKLTKAEERDQCSEVISTMDKLKEIPRERQKAEKALLNFVLAYLRMIGVEETLIATIPPALGWTKANVVRGPFDEMALKEVQQRLETRRQKLADRVDGGDDLKAEYIAEEAKKKKALEKAQEKTKASAESAKDEKDRVEELERQQAAAKDAVKNFDSDVAKAHQQKAALVFSLETLTSQMKGKFKEVLNWSSEDPPEEEPPGEAAEEEADEQHEEKEDDDQA